MTQDQLAVLATITDMTAAFHESDINGVMNAYESDATVMFEPGLPVTGDANLRAGFQKFFDFKPRFTYGEHEVIIQGDTAVHTTPWNMTGTTPDGQAITQSGLSVAVLNRQADGSWRMLIDNPHGAALTPPS